MFMAVVGFVVIIWHAGYLLWYYFLWVYCSTTGLQFFLQGKLLLAAWLFIGSNENMNKVIY